MEEELLSFEPMDIWDNDGFNYLEDGSSWRDGSLFGLVNLSGVIPLEESSNEDFVPPAIAPVPTNPKRNRNADSHEHSNKKREVNLGEPVNLPAYGQNLLLDQDLELAKSCPATVDRIRKQIRDFQMQGINGWHETVLQDIATEQTKAKIPWDTKVLKPATILVLEQFEYFLEELKQMVIVDQNRVNGSSDLNDLVKVVIMSAGPGHPTRQKDVNKAVVGKVVTSLPNVTIQKVTGAVLDEQEKETKLKVNYKASIKEGKQIFELAQINFPTSSKCNYCLLGVRVSLLLGSKRTDVELVVPEGFVIISNEKQWLDSYSTILQRTVFGLSRSMSYYRMCNVFQKLYLRGIREEDLADPKRPLSPSEFAYILELRLNSKTFEGTVELEKFLELWEWFGAIVGGIRHDKIILEMWAQGYIMGFVFRKVAEDLLIKEKPGSFLIRFSNQAPGMFAIAFTSPDGTSVNHYLLKRSELNQSNTLAMFLLSKPFFNQLLQTLPSFGTPSWQRVEKENALRKYGRAENSVAGYDDQLNIPFQNLSLHESS